MSEASRRYNALPFEVRKIASLALIERQVLDYKIEIDRAKKAHKKHLESIRNHLKNCEQDLERALQKTGES